MGSGAAFYVLEDLDRTKKRRSKRKPFDKNLHYYKDEGIKNKFASITPQMRQQIQAKIQTEQQQSKRKLLITLSIVTVILTTVLYYLLFKIKISDSFFTYFTFGG